MLKRIITGIVALPVVIFLIHQGGYLFDAAIFALATVGLFEFRNMARANGQDVYWLSTGMTMICLIYAASVFRYISVYSFLLFPAILMLGVILVMLEGMARHHEDGKWAYNTALSVMAVVYIGFGFAHFILLRDALYFTSADLQVSLWGLPIDRGEILFWVIMLGVWASDTFAYFAGSAFGKHKLCPTISPNKSVEGAVAGFIGSVAVIMGGLHYLNAANVFQGSTLLAVMLGVGVAIVAPLGDLVESILKRNFGVKDSGKIFPGHGGVLDRCDSLLFAIPVGYYVFLLSVMVNSFFM